MPCGRLARRRVHGGGLRAGAVPGARSQTLRAGTAAIAGARRTCSAHDEGAYTGEVSAAMLAEFGCRYVIVGHSERRAVHGESDELVADKAKAALAHGLTPIVCVGETLAEREAGQTDEVVKRQLAAVIHTHRPLHQRDRRRLRAGLGDRHRQDRDAGAGAGGARLAARAAATPATAHADRMRILYGGSVKADNAAALFAQPDIDGGLIGGASLKAADFCRSSARRRADERPSTRTSESNA